MPANPLESPVLLVTGFGPFENYPENPSGDVAAAADGSSVAGVRVVGRRIPVHWREAWEAVRAAVAEHRPRALLCLGVAPDSFIRLEVLAKNAARPCPDVGGQKPQLFALLRIVEGAPAAYWTTLPVDWLQGRLAQRHRRTTTGNEAGTFVSAEPWPDAGWYLCNYLFYHVMHFLGGQVPYRGFVHVPRYPAADAGAGAPRGEVLAAGVFLVEELARWLGEQEDG
jgi:pyroglutamyl-peptidase